MDILRDLLLNYYFLSFIIAWIISVVIKSGLNGFSIKEGFKNGGMPSSHSCAVSAITFAILATEDFSPLFFVSVVFSAVIISDAFRLRRVVGMQGDSLNMLLRKIKAKPLEVVYGHTFTQVILGIVLGVVVSLTMYLIMF